MTKKIILSIFLAMALNTNCALIDDDFEQTASTLRQSDIMQKDYVQAHSNEDLYKFWMATFIACNMIYITKASCDFYHFLNKYRKPVCKCLSTML